MTTTISLATYDCIVAGCDSLATSTRHLLEPLRFASAFFDDAGDLRLGEDGQPLLKSLDSLSAFLETIPVNQLPSVTKLFSLDPAHACLLFAGISNVGERSIRHLVETFKESEPFKRLTASTYEINEIAQELSSLIKNQYRQAFAQLPQQYWPSMELLLSGYSQAFREPEIVRMTFGASETVRPEVERGKFDIVFGGQHDVIERVVHGIDLESYINLKHRVFEILQHYRTIVQEHLARSSINVDLPEPDTNREELALFGRNFRGVTGIFGDTATLSEQAAIDFVEFLVNTMIKAQEFSGSIPTVGGEVHVGLITKVDGFRWISKEEYKFKGISVPKFS